MPEWDPEVVVDAERASALIGGQFAALASAPIREIGTGWDNVVYLVEERWAFRFPQREIAVPGIRREIDTLGRLAPHLPLPIPVPRFVGEPADGYPWPWFGAGYLPGIELAESELPDAGRSAVGASLGAFLRALHAPGLAARVGAGLPVDPMRRADMGFRVPYARRRLDQVIADGLWQPTAAVERLLGQAAGLPPPPRTVVLHGDLHARHVLVGTDGSATGIIDWGDVSLGDPSADLSIAFGSLAGEARAACLAAYGPVDRLTELRARVIATFLAAALLGYAHDRGWALMAEEQRRALERVVD